MATDIAFALGVLALFGSRVPIALKLFLTALAIVDDILAVLVIPLFYTSQLDLSSLLGALVVVLALMEVNRLGLDSLLVYLMLGVILWLFAIRSGIHPTVAGIVLGMTIPTTARIDPALTASQAEGILNRNGCDSLAERTVLTDGQLQEDLQVLGASINDVQAPLQELEHALHPWLAFAIVPLLALANAGVRLDIDPGNVAQDRVTIGIMLGLVLGKHIGITLFAWPASRSGLARLTEDVTWRQIYAVTWLGGVGFTMSLFMADLAYDDASLTATRLGILAASMLAGMVG